MECFFSSIFSSKASLAPCLRILGFMETLLQITRVYEALVFILIRFQNFPHHGVDVCDEYVTTLNILNILDKYFTRIQLFLVRSQEPFAALVDCKEKRTPLLDQVISSQSGDH